MPVIHMVARSLASQTGLAVRQCSVRHSRLCNQRHARPRRISASRPVSRSIGMAPRPPVSCGLSTPLTRRTFRVASPASERLAGLGPTATLFSIEAHRQATRYGQATAQRKLCRWQPLSYSFPPPCPRQSPSSNMDAVTSPTMNCRSITACASALPQPRFRRPDCPIFPRSSLTVGRGPHHLLETCFVLFPTTSAQADAMSRLAH